MDEIITFVCYKTSIVKTSDNLPRVRTVLIILKFFFNHLSKKHQKFLYRIISCLFVFHLQIIRYTSLNHQVHYFLFHIQIVNFNLSLQYILIIFFCTLLLQNRLVDIVTMIWIHYRLIFNQLFNKELRKS